MITSSFHYYCYSYFFTLVHLDPLNVFQCSDFLCHQPKQKYPNLSEQPTEASSLTLFEVPPEINLGACWLKERLLTNTPALLPKNLSLDAELTHGALTLKFILVITIILFKQSVAIIRVH